MLPLTTCRIRLEGEAVHASPEADLAATLLGHTRRDAPEGGVVVLGGFGAGKTSILTALAAAPERSDHLPCTFVPLAVLGRSASLAEGLQRTVGRARLEEARRGERVLLLDGLDEVPDLLHQGYPALFDELVALAGPRWILTSRPSHVRTSINRDPDQVDTLERPDVVTLRMQPLTRQTVREVIGELPNGRALLSTVDGLEDLATSPLLLHIIHAAIPFIEPGRPIDAWGLFDAWLRYALHSGPDHNERLSQLEHLTWDAFRAGGFATEVMSFSPDAIAAVRLPASLARTLLVTELDGRVRFGHRSVFEYLLASKMAPQITANQHRPPDELSGLRITDATRAFLVGRLPRMPVAFHGDRALIPRGNFIAGGANSADERPLRVQHLAEPFWISRMPVTQADWARWLTDHPDDRPDANYLAHWGPERQLPPGGEDLPIYGITPDDADRFAAAHGARLPTADEWEKAVRGLDGRRWPWGEHWRPAMAVTAELGLSRPLSARAFGAQGEAHLFSAVGGVFECTSTWWRDRPERGRVVMGGCYSHPASTSRAALRLSHTLSGHLKVGLRLAWSA